MTITLGHADTTNFPYAAGPLIYELFVISPGGTVTPFQEGRVFVNPSVIH